MTLLIFLKKANYHQFFHGLLSGGLGTDVLFAVKKALGADDMVCLQKTL